MDDGNVLQWNGELYYIRCENEFKDTLQNDGQYVFGNFLFLINSGILKYTQCTWIFSILKIIELWSKVRI